MKRTRSGVLFYPSKIIKTASELPVEIWHKIFALTTFDDQLNCRRICVRWRDLIATLPEFKNKVCLVLGYSSLFVNKPPLPHAQLPVASLKFTKMFEILKFLTYSNCEFYPVFRNLLLRFGEFLTHLDLSNLNDRKSYKIIVKNLSIFKVLKHFEVGSLIDWLRTINFRTPEKRRLSEILSIVVEANSDNLTYKAVKRFLDGNTDRWFPYNAEIDQYRHILLDKIKDDVKVLADENKRDSIAEEICSVIRGQDKLKDLSSYINTSVQIITIQDGETTSEDIENLMVLVPNLQEIIVDSNYFSWELLRKLPTKIIALSKVVRNANSLKDFNLCNLKHVEFFKGTTIQEVDRFIDLFPTLKTMNGYSHTLSGISELHFNYITKLDLELFNGDVTKGLCKLVEFKNLQELNVSMYISGREEENDDYHFFDHSPGKLESLKKFHFYFKWGKKCVECMDSLFKSMANLRVLMLYAAFDWNILDTIFRYQSRLETLKLHNTYLPSNLPFEPNNQWPEMKSLRYLDIKYPSINGSKACWNRFGKKLKKLKYFRAETHRAECVDLEQMIGNNMPALQSVLVSQSYQYENPKLVVRGKNKYTLQKYCNR